MYLNYIKHLKPIIWIPTLRDKIRKIKETVNNKGETVDISYSSPVA
jgi:hypothetical protein